MNAVRSGGLGERKENMQWKSIMMSRAAFWMMRPRVLEKSEVAWGLKG
jgi:hypothetical protein